MQTPSTMKPLLHKPSSNNINILVFCVTLLMITIINTPTCLCDDAGKYTNCKNSFSCQGSNISSDLTYPFWGGNRNPYCGGVSNNPEMELVCESTVPKITFNEVKYRILKWESNRLTLARDDYGDGDICTVTDSKNSTFDNIPFQRDAGQFAISLLYNCDANQNSASMLNSITCDGGSNVVYTVMGPSSVPCSPRAVVMIPIMGDQVSQIVSTNGLTDALEKGFELVYSGDYAECGRCLASTGACGNDGEKNFRCFCQDGPHITTCNSPKASSSSSKNSSKVAIAIVAGALLFSVVAAILVMIICKRRSCLGFVQKKIFRKTRTLLDDNVQEFIKAYKLSMPKQYSYAEVKRITNSFRDKLGQGGYGVVYKANLSDGRQVAVKLINESKGDGEEFINEVASISRTSHVNIVSLLGFCYEKNKRALIYELLVNGSLDKFIYKEGFPSAISDLDWNTMYQIAVGIARGLEYLHQGCNSRILHLDIKPQNILLDEDFCPKISDFGLAKICLKKESIVSILGTRGTIGFIAPEVFSRTFGGVSHKSDVYSYGMLIVEMIGGRKNYDVGGSHTSEMYFPDWIYKDLELSDNLKNDLTTSDEEKDMIRKITMISLWCIQMNPLDRPSMSKVIEMLQGPLHSVPYPTRPVLSSPKMASLQSSYISSSNLLESNSITIQEDVRENQRSSINTMENVTVM